MIDLLLVNAIAAAIKSQFPSVFVGASMENTEIELPAIMVEMKSDAVVGGPLYRGTMTISVATQADDSTPEVHAEFTDEVGTFVKSLALTEPVKMCGTVYQNFDTTRNERHWISTMNYIVGFTPAS